MEGKIIDFLFGNSLHCPDLMMSVDVRSIAKSVKTSIWYCGDATKLTVAPEISKFHLSQIQKRYGADVKAEIFEDTEMGEEKKIKTRIKVDSRIARRRLETGLLVANAKLFG